MQLFSNLVKAGPTSFGPNGFVKSSAIARGHNAKQTMPKAIMGLNILNRIFTS